MIVVVIVEASFRDVRGVEIFVVVLRGGGGEGEISRSPPPPFANENLDLEEDGEGVVVVDIIFDWGVAGFGCLLGVVDCTVVPPCTGSITIRRG